MSTSTFVPPFTAVDRALAALKNDGYAVLDPAGLSALVDIPLASLDGLAAAWADLPPDAHLKDGGRYRRRRHASYVLDADAMTRVAHRAHWQPVEYNALHGGMRRWFDPVTDALSGDPTWTRLVTGIGATFARLRTGPAEPWFVEAHQFRIDTTNGIGRPTPEGAHRDGVDFVAVILVARRGVKGGETRVFDADGPRGQRFTMVAPWTALLLDDARVIHETTPIQPDGDEEGVRDTLVLTYRTGAFQGDE